MSQRSSVGHFIGLGFELTGMVVAGVFLGRYVGQEMGHQGLGTAGGAVLGFSLWLYRVLVVLKNMENKDS